MKSLNFDTNNIRVLTESKKDLRRMFWTDLETEVRFRVRDMIQQQINEEFDVFIGASWYKHSQERLDWRNGHWMRTLETKYGLIQDLKIPRARKIKIEFSIFNRWQRFQDDLLEAILQAYLIGNSTSNVTELVEYFCGTTCSRQFVRKLLKNFDDKLQDYLNRKIDKQWPFLFIDGMRIRIKEGTEIKDRVVIWALGYDYDGNRSILGYFIAHTESATAVTTLLKDLYKRGFKRPKLIICDEAKAIVNSAMSEFPHTDIQVCTLHKLKTFGRNLKKMDDIEKETRYKIIKDASWIYKAKTKKSALKRYTQFLRKYRFKAPEAIRCFKNGFNLTLTYYDFEPDIQKSIKTNNMIERMNRAARYILRKYLYFHERHNARIALFTFVCRYEQKHYSSKEAVSLSFHEKVA